jgi:hypothetical protein
MNIAQRLITRNFQGGRSQPILNIVMHTYNGAGTSLYNWFQNNDRGVSSHYAVMKDGTVEQYVRDEDTAFHAGGWDSDGNNIGDFNDKGIGIEHQDDGNPNDPVRTHALYEASAQLVAELHQRHGVHLNRDRIVLHREVTSTGCPGALDVDKIIARAKQIVELQNAAKNDDLYRVVIDGMQQGAYAKRAFAFDAWYEAVARNPRVTLNGSDITSEFQSTMTELQQRAEKAEALAAEKAQEVNSLKDSLSSYIKGEQQLKGVISDKDAEIKQLQADLAGYQGTPYNNFNLLIYISEKIRKLLGRGS